MGLDHEKLIELLSNAAAIQTAAEREAFLEVACRGNPELRAQIDTLLRAHDRAGDFLQARVELRQVPPADHYLGATIGRYRLLRKLGEGGFGMVYLAEQVEPVQRQVALKIIKPGMDTREVVARFEAERQALALMDHPNIAMVLDAGTTENERPYFVMELVDGIPLTDYCDQNRLSTNQRLRLFIKVCHAVQHAHQKGVIHRDLKPTNVLVTIRDGEPVPKIIDFGVAKALGQKLTEKTLFTAFQQLVGTPAYMSPEQAELGGLDIDTRSDIYSLGVLLYELLTGVTPFDAETLGRAALDEVRRIICEKEPPKPSTRLRTLGVKQTEVAQFRSTQPHVLTRIVHGDLDWIVMKCLEKERGRRYQTADGVALDIERHLRNEPVNAAAPSKIYQAQKFIHRHQTGLATMAALALLLATGVVVSTWQAVRANQARRMAEKREAEARENLWASYLTGARASVTSERPGRRFATLEAVAKAAAIRPSPELRSAAVDALALVDVRTAREWEGFPASSIGTVALDGRFEIYARTDNRWNVSLRRVADDHELLVLPSKTAAHCFSPDGRFLAGTFSGRPPLLQVWNLDAGRLVLEELLDVQCEHSDFHPTAPIIAAGLAGGVVQLFDLETGRRWRTQSTNDEAYCLRFRPDGQQLAVAARKEPGVRIYDANSGELLVSLAHSNAVYHLDWSPDGRWLAAPCADGRVHLWDMREGGTLHRVLEAHEALVFSVCFDPRGEFLVSQSWDDTTAFWSLPSCNLILKCPGSESAMSFSRDGRWLGPCVNGRTVRVLEVARAPKARVLPANLAKDSCNGAFSPDARWIVLGGDGLQCWGVRSAQRLWHEAIGYVWYVAFRPGGEALLTLGETGACEWTWSVDAATGVPRLGRANRLTDRRYGGQAQYSRDGSVVVIAQPEGLWVSQTHGSPPITLPLRNCNFAVVSPDGRWGAAANWVGPGHEMKVWELPSGREAYHITNANPAMVFTSDSRWLLTFWNDALECLEVGTWRSVARVSHDWVGSPSFAISARNGWVAVCDKGHGSVQLSELPTLRPILTLSSAVQALAFSADDSLLLTRRTGGQLCLWDLRGIREELTPLGLGW